MSMSFELDAQARSDKGKGASRRLRRGNLVPAIMYGADKDPMPLAFDHNLLVRSLAHEAFYSTILTVKVGGSNIKAVIKDLQRHPSEARILHMDLQRIDESKKLRMHVPLHFINEAIAPGVKLGGGIVNHLMNNIEVSCLPRDLPEYVEVDLSNLELNHSVHLSDLKLPQGVEIHALTQGPEHDLPVATIIIPRAAVEEAAAAAAAPAEGAAAPAAAAPAGEKKAG